VGFLRRFPFLLKVISSSPKAVFSAGRNCDFGVFVLSLFGVTFSRYLDHWVVEYIIRGRDIEIEI
jgi:hypothetical protein